jgi:hypothetical protein
MNNSLKDQLVSLGLAKTPKPAGRKSKNSPIRSKNADSSVVSELSLEQAYNLRKNEEKQSAELKKEQKRLKDLERRNVNRRIQK